MNASNVKDKKFPDRDLHEAIDLLSDYCLSFGEQLCSHIASSCEEWLNTAIEVKRGLVPCEFRDEDNRPHFKAIDILADFIVSNEHPSIATLVIQNNLMVAIELKRRGLRDKFL